MTILEEINSLYDKCFSESNAARRTLTKPKKDEYILNKEPDYKYYPHQEGEFGYNNFSPLADREGPGFKFNPHGNKYFINNRASKMLIKELDPNNKNSVVFITGRTADRKEKSINGYAIKGTKDLYYAVWIPGPEPDYGPFKDYDPEPKKINGKYFWFSGQLLEPKSVVKLKNNIPLTTSDLSNGNIGKTDAKLTKRQEGIKSEYSREKRKEQGLYNYYNDKIKQSSKKDLRLKEVYNNFYNIVKKYKPYVNVKDFLYEFENRIRKSSTPQQRLKIFSGFESRCVDKQLNELKSFIIDEKTSLLNYQELIDNIFAIQHRIYFFDDSERKISYIKKINLLIEKLIKATTEEEKQKIANAIDSFLKNTIKEIKQIFKENKNIIKPFSEEIEFRCFNY